MRRVHPDGLFEANIQGDAQGSSYQLRVEDERGQLIDMHDPYAFAPMLTDYDLHLMGEGKHYESYQRMGAQVRVVDGVSGVNFAVWAPNATGVSVIGDFNSWDPRTHAMHKHVPSGVWELFIPNLKVGEIYKYRVFSGGRSSDKTDPYGFAAEQPPRTASIVTDLNRYAWQDAGWMQRRAEHDPLQRPLSIYEVHLGSWKRFAAGPCDWLGYRQLAEELVEYCQKMGYTHIELLPITEHPFTGSWGYQTVGYFAPDQPLRAPRRLHVLCRLLSPAQHRSDSRLGTGSLSPR